jgi:hypothetical protein
MHNTKQQPCHLYRYHCFKVPTQWHTITPTLGADVTTYEGRNRYLTQLLQITGINTTQPVSLLDSLCQFIVSPRWFVNCWAHKKLPPPLPDDLPAEKKHTIRSNWAKAISHNSQVTSMHQLLQSISPISSESIGSVLQNRTVVTTYNNHCYFGNKLDFER